VALKLIVFLEQGMLARNLCEFNIFHIINENFNLFSCVLCRTCGAYCIKCVLSEELKFWNCQNIEPADFKYVETILQVF